MLITTLQYIQSLPGNSISAHPRNRTTAHPRNRASTQPRSPHRASGAPASGNPLHDCNSLPCSIMDRLYFSVTQKGRVSPITRKGLSLLLGLVRRPQHLPLGLQPRSPERSPHYPPSIQRYAGLFRTWSTSLPDSTAQLIRPAGRTNFFPDYPPPITRTSSYTISHTIPHSEITQ